MNTPEPTKSIPLTREFCLGLDSEDPLSAHRARFQLPQGVIYLDGNSLGALPKTVPQRLREAVEVEWGDGLIRSWNDADWYPAPQRVGSRIARLIGAGAREVIAADSTSVNLFKVLCAALRMRPGRKVILGEKDNFPTDAYIASGVSSLMGAQFRAVEASDVLDAIDETVAIVSLTHVNYRTGRLYDMAAITARAHEVGALVVWDLCHTAGAMPCDLNGCGADFAVGCGYKYLNGGPGAPAFVFVAERHQEALDQPLSGWHGHAKPFEFVQQYQPATGIDRMLVGTAPQLGLIALEEALHAFDDVDMAALRRKSERMTELFIELVDQELDGFTVATPREAALRGSQVSLAHEHGYAIMQVLIERGVIGDFRAPNILRFGFAVLYLRFADVWDAVAQIKDVMATGAWKSDRYMVRKAVT
ncbi:kynureninase [Variovorax sp. V15]|uniref:kynureninase n=1 Tax=unclassified Variovorax TaxID=663243 RepID=UPI0034E8B022